MALETLTYLAGGPDGKIHVKKSQRAIGGVEVLVRVTHSGVCGTDVHDRDSGCGLGHEGVGIVSKVGDSVTAVKIGQRVGWGCVAIFSSLGPSLTFSTSLTVFVVVGNFRHAVIAVTVSPAIVSTVRNLVVRSTASSNKEHSETSSSNIRTSSIQFQTR